jgi:hypothetical protein
MNFLRKKDGTPKLGKLSFPIWLKMKKYDKFLNFISRVKRQRLENFRCWHLTFNMLEHCNFKGKIIGFYTFEGFPSVDG